MSTRQYLSINRRGHLAVAGQDIVTLARKYGTPLYLMNEDLIRSNCRRYMAAMKRHGSDCAVAYASKAFMTGWICSVIADEGLHMDVVSGGELYTAIRAGFPAERLMFHGNNKSLDEITMGLREGVGRFVVDSYLELADINSVAANLGIQASVILRLSPGVEAHTHEYIETGMLDSKFGFAISNGEALQAVKLATSMANVRLVGLHSHIGSQIMTLEGPVAAAKKMLDFISLLRSETGVEIEELDLGGGLGVVYTAGDEPPSIESYVDTVMSAVFHACDMAFVRRPKVYLEPGRSIVGEAGITVYTAGAIKEIPGVRTYVSIDGGMSDNPRPALYGAVYEAILANRAEEIADSTVCLAGKCCESGDIIIRDARLPVVRSGDIVAVLTTGAYCYSMASNYNRLPRPAVVALSDGRSRVVVRRETYADLVSNDVFPTVNQASLRTAVGRRQ